MRFFQALAVAVWLISSLSAADESLYGKVIERPSDLALKTQEAVADLSQILRQMTGSEFAETDQASRASIRLIRAEASDPALSKLGREAFRIHSTSESPHLTITGNTDLALQQGIYFYLEKLGCRWLLPNDRWEEIPKRDSIRLEIDRVEEPDFRIRDFFGTGGFGGKLPLDPNLELQARWAKWKARNRLGGDIRLGGHAGEAFNVAYREILEAHPEYLAEIDGKRQEWGQITKLCHANPELRQLWVKDRLEKFIQVYDRDPESPGSLSVSVEPADGGGHCECADCLKIGTVSDRVFDLANEVARAIGKEYPGRYVNLYAYNEHALVPKFDLEPNVFVLVAPYAFQRTGLPGNELVKAWGPKANSLGIYDYWAIPDWANCLPAFSYSRQAPTKIRFWNENGVNAFLGESSYSSGNVGPVWYLASRLLWDVETNESTVMDEFFSAFGPSAPPMRRMLERWARDFSLTEHELALSFRDIDEAFSLAQTEKFRTRVQDFAFYIHYLRLWHEYQTAKPRSSDRAKTARTLVKYLWRIYPTAMVHSYRMHQLVCLRYEREDTGLQEEWPLKNADHANWKSIKPISPEEISQLIASGKKAFTPLQFETPEYTHELVPLHRPQKLDSKMVMTPNFAGDHEFEFWIPPGTESLGLQLRCGKRDNYPGNMLIVYSPDGKEVFRHLAPSDGEWHEVTLPTKQNGNYRMNISDQKIFFNLKIPENLPFVVKGWKACPALPSKGYIYVPSGLNQLAILSPSVVPLQVYNPAGELIEHSDTKLFTVPIPNEQQDQVWSVSHYKAYTPLKLLNAPNNFAFSPLGVMKPAP